MKQVIVKPIFSEKSVKEAQLGRYTFQVARRATKDDIKKAIEKSFGVHVTGVFTNIIKGTRVRNTRIGRVTTDLTYKKARVALKKGEKIDMFEAGEEKKS